VRRIAVLLGVLFVRAVFADNPGTIPFGNPVYAGSGCPKNSVSSLKTEEAITLLFDSYSVSAAGRADVANCHLRIPVSIPANWRAEITSVDYRGFASLDKSAWMTLVSWFKFGHRQFGGSKPTVIRGEKEEDFFRRDIAFRIPGTRPVCGGGKVNLDLYNILTAYAPRGREAAAFIDSIDGALSFSLKWARCR
jgi:hypothetical protein